MKIANKYLIEGKYEEAILTFNKVIKFEPNSKQPRVELAKVYVRIDKFDEAIEVLKEAQQIDIKNEKLLLEILEILNNVDSEIAYELLNNYINSVGKNNISKEIEEIANISNKKISNIIVNQKSGTYINPISVKLSLDEIIVGHRFYYTIDGTDPNLNSIKYKGKIDINKDTEIKLISYNRKNQPSKVVSFEYKIDGSMLVKLKTLIKECKLLINKTEEGISVGNCISGSKAILMKDINNAQKIYDDILSRQKDIDNMKNTLKKSVQMFKNSKVLTMPKDLGDKYLSKLIAIDKEAEYVEIYNMDLSNLEMGNILGQCQLKYENVLNEIFLDLEKYLNGEAKENIKIHKQEYYKDKQSTQNELDEEHIQTGGGTWIVTAQPATLGDVARSHAEKLIYMYMK